MPVVLHCQTLPLSLRDVEDIWQAVRQRRQHADEDVAVQCVSTEHIQGLNRQYRQKDIPTNVLTFSYDREHDVILCTDVARREAHERNCSERDYIALLLVHGFLHITGLDHEQSAAQAQVTRRAEQELLQACGFASDTL